MNKFQSTLPHGSDDNSNNMNIHINNFNPRSLTGATCRYYYKIAIDANFNPRSLTGATDFTKYINAVDSISIHAPSRERQGAYIKYFGGRHFNPRSLTGATCIYHRYRS